jgi:hypothetical protein
MMQTSKIGQHKNFLDLQFTLADRLTFEVFNKKEVNNGTSTNARHFK